MGPYGSVGAHIKTGRSPIAHDHFQTPPDPKGADNTSDVQRARHYQNPLYQQKARAQEQQGVWGAAAPQ